MELAIAKARTHNVAAVTVVQQAHVGRVADYPLMAARAGLSGSLFCTRRTDRRCGVLSANSQRHAAAYRREVSFGDTRCREFVDLWHRALAAGTASFIHLAGPGRFYFTGHNVGFVDVPLLRAHLETMVKMSPLQSFSLEVLPNDDETALLGAGVSALRALTW